MAVTDIIEVSGLCVRFGPETIFNGMSFSIQPGQKVAVEGRSGSGKSTLFKCLLGFVIPNAGEIRFCGQTANAQTIWWIRRQIAYLAQEPDLGRGRVREILERPFRYRANAGQRHNLARTEALCERFFLSTDVLDKEVTSLSAGQRQRVGLIGAILLDRSVYLLDEVTSALDALSRRAVMDFFAGISSTVIWIAHDQRIVAMPDQTITVGLEEEP